MKYNSHHLPGPGDEETWGPVCDERDPRYVERDDNEDEQTENDCEPDDEEPSEFGLFKFGW